MIASYLIGDKLSRFSRDGGRMTRLNLLVLKSTGLCNFLARTNNIFMAIYGFVIVGTALTRLQHAINTYCVRGRKVCINKKLLGRSTLLAIALAKHIIPCAERVGLAHRCFGRVTSRIKILATAGRRIIASAGHNAFFFRHRNALHGHGKGLIRRNLSLHPFLSFDINKMDHPATSSKNRPALLINPSVAIAQLNKQANVAHSLISPA